MSETERQEHERRERQEHKRRERQEHERELERRRNEEREISHRGEARIGGENEEEEEEETTFGFPIIDTPTILGNEIKMKNIPPSVPLNFFGLSNEKHSSSFQLRSVAPSAHWQVQVEVEVRLER
jgi:hypothetical protein